MQRIIIIFLLLAWEEEKLSTLAESELKFWKDNPSIPLTDIELPSVLVAEFVLFREAVLVFLLVTGYNKRKSVYY